MSNDNLIAFQSPESSASFNDALTELVRKGARQIIAQAVEAFFLWFESNFGSEYLIQGPVRAGRDVMLDEVLKDWDAKTPADILISRNDETPLVIGFARYDSDRGGSQEDDRTGGNRDKVTDILRYADTYELPLKVFFLNDGPGLRGCLKRGSGVPNYANRRTMRRIIAR